MPYVAPFSLGSLPLSLSALISSYCFFSLSLFFCSGSLTVASLFLGVGLVAGLAEASAALQVPVAVTLAEVLGRSVFDSVGDADAVRLLDGGQLATGRRGWEGSKRGRHFRTGDVIDTNGQQ